MVSAAVLTDGTTTAGAEEVNSEATLFDEDGTGADAKFLPVTKIGRDRFLALLTGAGAGPGTAFAFGTVAV